MQVTPGSQYVGCWDQSVSDCAGNPSSWGNLSPGLGGWGGSAQLVWGGSEPETPYLGRAPRGSSPGAAALCATREAVTEVPGAPSWKGIPEPKGSVVVPALPQPGNTQPIVNAPQRIVFESVPSLKSVVVSGLKRREGKRETFW